MVLSCLLLIATLYGTLGAPCPFTCSSPTCTVQDRVFSLVRLPQPYTCNPVNVTSLTLSNVSLLDNGSGNDVSQLAIFVDGTVTFRSSVVQVGSLNVSAAVIIADNNTTFNCSGLGPQYTNYVAGQADGADGFGAGHVGHGADTTECDEFSSPEVGSSKMNRTIRGGSGGESFGISATPFQYGGAARFYSLGLNRLSGGGRISLVASTSIQWLGVAAADGICDYTGKLGGIGGSAGGSILVWAPKVTFGAVGKLTARGGDSRLGGGTWNVD